MHTSRWPWIGGDFCASFCPAYAVMSSPAAMSIPMYGRPACVAFGKLGEFAEKYLDKGTRIVLEGRITTGSYTNREGQKVYTTEVVAEGIEFHGILRLLPFRGFFGLLRVLLPRVCSHVFACCHVDSYIRGEQSDGAVTAADATAAAAIRDIYDG